jgi:hypothetical protein
VRGDADEAHLLLDRPFPRDVAHGEDLDEAVELSEHMRDARFVDDDGDPAAVGVLGGAHGEGLDVETSAAKEAHGPIENARPILDDCYHSVMHSDSPDA